MLYEILKALHIVAVIAWMAGLLYLPRLFVYHADAEKGSQQRDLQGHGRRLLRGIMNPAMILVWIFGLPLVARRLVARRLVADEVRSSRCLPWSTTSIPWRKEFEADRNMRPATITAGGTRCRRC